ncbi:hypothetical protein DSM106972_056560 [Dulcicalothrix desertica PCC 7102]|uniref:Uncharacterized protein n=1 Tax=Dulcicalothrix desertica PCC 7102 TaxID=232991 RepID=A0A3S1AK01_9CYAN|nr:hypothetical protein [Dulcicalothrix desertica]RUT02736.1 hypothetical protein DSM106972_056560 [Dulcicalothrix desertica PCC 7102]TWH39029.1 hypothetical protein CAL7102_08233 [Dulcicalothrix desertica PCC 7102]
MFTDLPEDDAVLKPIEFPLTPKQRAIQQTKPWLNSAISRSKPMKALKALYIEMYQRNIAQEDSEDSPKD